MRDDKEKEKTKIRERERRAITTNIFRGLRKHGNYPLSARADINQVLRHLAAEAGWVVEPDGTTYRASSVTRGTEKQVGKNCPLCGSAKSSTTSTPTSSLIISGRGGECSTMVSPRTLSIEEPSLVDVNRPNQLQLQVSSHERSSSTSALAKSSPIVPYAHGGPENLHYSMLEQQLCLHKQEASITARDSAAHQFPTLMTPLMDGNHGR